MSTRKPVVKTVVMVETKSITKEMDGVRRAIETGLVDVQTITTLKRLLIPKITPTTSIKISSKPKSASLTSSKAKKPTKALGCATSGTIAVEEQFPSAELVSATKTIVMKTLTALATEMESRTKKTESSTETTSSKQPVSQGTRNVGVCCKLALEALRKWQHHVDIGPAWVNKAYLGYLAKLIALEMCETAMKELAILKSEIEKQLQVPAPITKRYVSSRNKLQATTKHNIPPSPNSQFDPLPLMSILCRDIDDEESIMLVCAYFNHLLRAVGVKRSYEADQTFIATLEAPGGPVSWIEKLPSSQSSQQIDHLSRALLKIGMNSTSPQIQLSLRTLRHRIALNQSSNNIDSIAKSTFQALRSYYAATKSDKEAYTVCAETLSPMLDKLTESVDSGKIVNFMGLLARKAGLLIEGMRWNDLGLRLHLDDKSTNALFILRNVGIIFSLSIEELHEMMDEQIQERLRLANNCLTQLEEIDSLAAEQLRDEVDYLRRALLSCPSTTLESKQYFQDIRQSFPRKLLRAFLFLADHNSTLLPKLVMPTRALIFDILGSLRTTFTPQSPPPHYLATLDLCSSAALKIQDNQTLQFTGNAYFNFGNSLFKAGKRKEARRLLEKSLELDFSPIPTDDSPTEEPEQRNLLSRCRKLEMLGECCVKGEEKDAFALILEALNVHLTTVSVDSGTMTLAQVMKKEEYLTRLTGVLTKFTKDQSGSSPGDDFPSINDEYSIVLNDTVPIEVKAVVYEIQVNVLLGMTHQGRYATARRICREVLNFYSDTQFPIRRVRVIERLLYIAIIEGDEIGDLLNIGASAITALTSAKVSGKDEQLLASRKVLLARCLAWMGLLSDNCDQPKNEYFSQALSIWTRWSEKLTDNPKEEDKDEIIEITRILELLSDFFEVKSLSLLRVQCLHLLLKFQSYLSKNLDALISLYASLALQYLNLGYTGKAGTLFAQSLKQMKDAEPSTPMQILWNLNYAEYFARIGIISKAKLHISQAGDVYARNFSNSNNRITPTERAERVLAVGRAGFVFSLIAFEENELEKAIGYIDYAIRVLKTGITAVEKAGRVVKVRSQDYDPFSSDPKPSVEQVENKGIQFGSKLWSFKSAFFMALLQHGVLLTFRGSARDSEFWLRQAYDAAKSVKSRNSMLNATLHLGDLFTRMSALINAHEFLSQAAELAEGVDKTKDSIVMDLSFFTIHGREDLWSDAFRSIIRAETKLKRLLEPGFVNGLEKGMAIDCVDRFANLRLSTESPARNVSVKSPKSSRGRSGRTSTTVSRVEYESVTFSKMQVTISENKGYSLARQARFEEGYLAMDSITDLDRVGSENLSARITRTKMLLLEIYQLLASDPLLCVLSESAVSIPNVHGKHTKNETPKSQGKRTRARSTKLSHSVNRLQGLLIQAQTSIESIFEHACILCPSTLAQVVGLLMGEARLLSSVVNDPDKDQSVVALKTIMLLGISSFGCADSDRSKSVMYRREQAALEYEAKQEYVSLKQVQWPEHKSRPDSPDEELSDVLASLNISPRKKNFTLTAETLLHGIPTGCTVVSIHLSESKEYFILSKVHSQGCVVVRLPLIKHPPEGDEEPFTFENAYAELTEIINLNNQSAQAAKDVPDRQTKEIWWTTRKELDARLALFLQNMETCWIGGFTGMFRGFFPNDEVFAKFRFAFRQILIKFLPSRKEGDDQMELDPRLLDLFLSLKSDKPEMDSDVADQVEDLICFALDNFKFHGEQIAIDEIDLDAMTIDIQEAIRCYHETVAARKQEHVILILDKGLHMFPWESLPCLRGKSVSRLPSLGSLMERIVDSPIGGASWPSVTPNRGFFILNPEGDLTHTQSQFENTLAKIDGWNGIVGRAPMGQEILSALKNNDIFLYFGHGSGEQYVKSVQVKRLQNCAVTMLFGCSSGKLRDAGDFEPWGTPFTYLLGGSPAMLANLWDVTDRDIDRLSYGVFSRWGLCDERPKSRGSDDGTFEPERAMGIDFGAATLGERKRQLQASMKGKKLVTSRKGVSLTEALALARDDCTLRYLNGAAPVIYGVPIFLEENRR